MNGSKSTGVQTQTEQASVSDAKSEPNVESSNEQTSLDFRMKKICTPEGLAKREWSFVENDEKQSEVKIRSAIDLEQEKSLIESQAIKDEKEEAAQYIKAHSIDTLFEYCLTLLNLTQPEKPYHFIEEFFGKLLKGKDDEGVFWSIPRTFYRQNLMALFRIFDRENNGFITLPQYKTGMEYIGASKFANPEPEGFRDNKIKRDTWVSEFTDAISRQITSFLEY